MTYMLPVRGRAGAPGTTFLESGAFIVCISAAIGPV
jgi:hypothetical protein